jgi:hypothetical protein
MASPKHPGTFARVGDLPDQPDPAPSPPGRRAPSPRSRTQRHRHRPSCGGASVSPAPGVPDQRALMDRSPQQFSSTRRSWITRDPVTGSHSPDSHLGVAVARSASPAIGRTEASQAADAVEGGGSGRGRRSVLSGCRIAAVRVRKHPSIQVQNPPSHRARLQKLAAIGAGTPADPVLLGAGGSRRPRGSPGGRVSCGRVLASRVRRHRDIGSGFRGGVRRDVRPGGRSAGETPGHRSATTSRGWPPREMSPAPGPGSPGPPPPPHPIPVVARPSSKRRSDGCFPCPSRRLRTSAPVWSSGILPSSHRVGTEPKTP